MEATALQGKPSFYIVDALQLPDTDDTQRTIAFGRRISNTKPFLPPTQCFCSLAPFLYFMMDVCMETSASHSVALSKDQSHSRKYATEENNAG